MKQPGGGEERKAGLAADPQLLPPHCYCLCHPGTCHPMGALPWPQTSSLEALPKKYTRAVEWAGEGLPAAGHGPSCFCWHWHSSLESHWYPRVPAALGSWGMGKAKVWGFARSQQRTMMVGAKSLLLFCLFRYMCKINRSRSDQLQRASPKDHFCSFTNVLNAELHEYICIA